MAKGGLDFSGDVAPGPQEDVSDPAMFACSCGDPLCGGFGAQKCEFSGDSVLWRVCRRGAVVELEFDRIHYEY